MSLPIPIIGKQITVIKPTEITEPKVNAPSEVGLSDRIVPLASFQASLNEGRGRPDSEIGNLKARV